MANTVDMGPSGVIAVIPDGVTDFDVKDYFPNGVYLRSIMFTQSNAADKLYVRDKTELGPFLTPDYMVGGDSLVEVEPKRRFPYIKAADCTFTTPADCKITLFFS